MFLNRLFIVSVSVNEYISCLDEDEYRVKMLKMVYNKAATCDNVTCYHSNNSTCYQSTTVFSDL